MHDCFFVCACVWPKVMGLQKIFAATTAVVGLLIAVDYGLCDSFRCRGVDVPPGVAATGWQSRAVWTMGYIVALAAWTLQWLLLEGDVVTTFPVCICSSIWLSFSYRFIFLIIFLQGPTTGPSQQPSAVDRFAFGGHVDGSRRRRPATEMPAQRCRRSGGHSLGQAAVGKATRQAKGRSGGRLAAWHGIHGGTDVGSY